MSQPVSGEQRPLDLDIVRRLFTYTRPHRSLRNALIFFVLLRAVQVPLVTWSIAAVISGPIANHDQKGVLWGVLGEAEGRSRKEAEQQAARAALDARQQGSIDLDDAAGR